MKRIPTSSIRIHRTTKSCEVVDQMVYADLNDNGSWRIHNIKGKPFDIPADKLYHPLARFFMNPTKFNWFVVNLSIKHWRKKIVRVTLKLPRDFRVSSDDYGVFITNKAFKDKKYYFQFRKEEYSKIKEFVGNYVH